MPHAPAAERWAECLAGWAIPDHILQAAPESPFYFPPELFAAIAREALDTTEVSASRRRAAEAVPPGGSVLDVGCGGGAASLPLAPPAGLLVGLDPSEEMLVEYARLADERGAAHSEVLGGWPDVADDAPTVDVVVCHNVVYDVPDLPPFVEALTAHARRRVVVEMSADHPTMPMGVLWKAIHGIERPARPTADDAIEVLTDMGLDVGVERFTRQWNHVHERSQRVAFLRRRLCVGPERDAEIDALLTPEIASPIREVVTLWWDTGV